jgi:hypothetical protein
LPWQTRSGGLPSGKFVGCWDKDLEMETSSVGFTPRPGREAGVLSLADVQCEEKLGGLLKHYTRRVA